MTSKQPPWIWDLLECPRCHGSLSVHEPSLTCREGHRFPVIDGIPILVDEGLEATHPAVSRALEYVRNQAGIQPEESHGDQEIDSYVAASLVGTCGNMYRQLRRLTRYPIPHLELPGISTGLFLDVGSGWGRWGLAAARRGFSVCCVDASFDMCRAARRVAQHLGIPLAVVAGDARQLPLRGGSFNVVFSYSVIQHFSRSDARLIAREIARVCRPHGRIMVQMPNRAGLRNSVNRLFQLLRKDSNPFRVRYWTLREIEELWRPWSSTMRIRVDGYFSLNPRIEDSDLLPMRYRLILLLSNKLRHLSCRWPRLVGLADSVWVECTRTDTARVGES